MLGVGVGRVLDQTKIKLTQPQFDLELGKIPYLLQVICFDFYGIAQYTVLQNNTSPPVLYCKPIRQVLSIIACYLPNKLCPNCKLDLKIKCKFS